jgi:hypothetical protein
LIIKFPDTTNFSGCRTIRGMVENIDIMPSILDFLGCNNFPMDGTSFVGLINNEGAEKEYICGLGLKKSLFIRSRSWSL